MPYIAQDYYGKTPLHLAVLEGHEEVVKELLDYRVNIATTNFKGQTVLHLTTRGYSLFKYRTINPLILRYYRL